MTAKKAAVSIPIAKINVHKKNKYSKSVGIGLDLS
jgi:hypothetical protein